MLNNTSDEIELSEVFKALWAYKTFISLICIFGVISGLNYYVNADKLYKSEAVFKLSSSRAANINLQSQLALFSSLTGSGVNSISNVPSELVEGRVFIEELDDELDFRADKFFNTFNPNYIEPKWKSTIKKALGWQKNISNNDEIIWQGIKNIYLNHVALEEMSDGALKVSVLHENPHKASKIANTIMNKILSDKKRKENKEQDDQLMYLSKLLGKSLNDLEVSQTELKNFTLENTALPLESFAAVSLSLDIQREQLDRTSELEQAVSGLHDLYKAGLKNKQNLSELRKSYPIIDRVEFRRLFGLNEAIGTWSWPDRDTIISVSKTLQERINTLSANISVTQENAEQSREALEKYGKLKRKSTSAEATYAVLMEQVKAQSLMAGYRPDSSEIYEFAVASVNASTPNLRLSVSLAFILSLGIALLLTSIIINKRGVFYSKKTIIRAAKSDFNANAKYLLKIRNQELKNIEKLLTAKQQTVLRDLAVEVYKSNSQQVIITSSRVNCMAFDIAKSLACYMQSNSMKIAIINFSIKKQKLTVGSNVENLDFFELLDSNDQVSILRPSSKANNLDILNHKDFSENLKSLNKNFDLVLFCADNHDAFSLLRSFGGQEAFHISIARIKHTKFEVLTEICKLVPINGFLYV